MEIWKPVVGYENLYSVSNYGNVRSENRVVLSKNGTSKQLSGRQLVARKNRTGYMVVFLCKDGVAKPYQVHRLVGEAFVKNTKNLPCINHKNCIRDDNRAENLEWVTYSQNNKYAYSMGKKPISLSNEKNPMAKRIIQFFKDGSTKEYSCAVVASQETNIPVKNICATCRMEQHTAGGFAWRWK